MIGSARGLIFGYTREIGRLIAADTGIVQKANDHGDGGNYGHDGADDLWKQVLKVAKHALYVIEVKYAHKIYAANYSEGALTDTCSSSSEKALEEKSQRLLCRAGVATPDTPSGSRGRAGCRVCTRA